MNIIRPRKDFVIIEDFFDADSAQEWIQYFLKKGEDPDKGFHHPKLRPNRFHKSPRYPVKKYMCLGLYWNPVDYLYYYEIPENAEKPFAIPKKLRVLCDEILHDFFPWKNFCAEAVLVNMYTQDSSMGLHIDKDEDEKHAPVIGLNFGSTCRFFYEDEAGEMRDIRIKGNSVYVFGDSARQMRHGLGSIYSKTLSAGSEKYLEDKERLNLTVRQVFKVN